MSEQVPVDKSLPEDSQVVSCEVCLRTVPLSEADVVEAKDYVAYFCGLDCYDQWRHRQSSEDNK